jgi:type IX secretion system PorP/SprF family membrane protein
MKEYLNAPVMCISQNKLSKFITMNKIIILSLMLMGAFTSALAQQDVLYGQYVFNNAIINPAQAGIQDQNQWGVLYRNQWVGVDGAPVSKSFFINMRLPRKLGFTFGAYQDEIGPINEVTLQGDLASHVQIASNWYASGGIRTMVSRTVANLLEVSNIRPGDPRFNQDISTGFYLNVGAGLVVFNKNTFFGAAMPRLVRREIGNQNNVYSRNERHLFVYGGTNIPINTDFTFTPSMLVRATSDAPVQVDLNALFNYKDLLDIGPAFRNHEAIGMIIGLKLDKNWYLGYMYDYPLTEINKVTRQSHEISLRFLWDSKFKNRIRSPRYFI